jgi:drug/metabolite transporter (DMT)-like permease
MTRLPLIWADPRPGVLTDRGPIVLGLVTLYLVWGATYLAIHIALESIPPLFLIASRSLLAGAILAAASFAAGYPWPSGREWGGAAVVGTLLFVFCHGVLAIAQQHVPSGMAALLMATIPLWVSLVEGMRARRHLLGVRPVLTIGSGFFGVTILLLEARGLGGTADILSVLALLLGALSWAVGTVASRTVALPASPVQAAGLELLVGGAIVLVASMASGELAQLSAASVSTRSLAALGYLTLFGSVLGFSAYIWLLGVTTPECVVTCAYINPIVAVLLGALFLGEPLTVGNLFAATIIVGSVAITVLDGTYRGRTSHVLHPGRTLPP